MCTRQDDYCRENISNLKYHFRILFILLTSVFYSCLRFHIYFFLTGFFISFLYYVQHCLVCLLSFLWVFFCFNTLYILFFLYFVFLSIPSPLLQFFVMTFTFLFLFFILFFILWSDCNSLRISRNQRMVGYGRLVIWNRCNAHKKLIVILYRIIYVLWKTQPANPHKTIPKCGKIIMSSN